MYQSIQEFIKESNLLVCKEEVREREEFQKVIAGCTRKELEGVGYAVLNLVIKGRSGFFNKPLLNFCHPLYLQLKKENKHQEQLFKEAQINCKFQSGDIVVIEAGGTRVNGVVHDKRRFKISVMIQKEQEANLLQKKHQFSITQCSVGTTYDRYKKTLQALSNQVHSPLLNLFKPQFVLAHQSYQPNFGSQFHSPKLNQLQNLAVTRLLAEEVLGKLHGPPGTGKTTTIAEYIHQEYRRGKKILVCTASNIAVDNLLQKLVNKKLNMLRLGHPSRLLQSSYPYCLQNLKSQNKLSKEIKSLKKQLKSLKIHKPNQKKKIHQLEIQIKDTQRMIINQIFQQVRIVLSTAVGAFQIKSKFDICVLDQACQCLQVASLIPSLKCKKIILSGDPFQLSPFTYNDLKPLYNRVIDYRSTMLCQQYRMNNQIMNWSSRQFYGGQLKVGKMNDRDQNGFKGKNYDQGLKYIDSGLYGQRQIDKSYGNQVQVKIVRAIYDQLKEQGVKSNQIGVISPYSAQVGLLKAAIQDVCLEISTVDSFQGRQKDIILLSLVRSNNQGNLGFLKDYRRINVSITRAKHLVYVIGDRQTMVKDNHLNSLLIYIDDNQMQRDIGQLGIQAQLGRYKIKDKKYNKSQNAKKKRKKRKQLNQDKQEDKQQEQFIRQKGQVQQQSLKKQLFCRFNKQIEEFIDSNIDQIVTQPLNPLERYVLHQVASRYQITHDSKGKGKLKMIILKKLGNKEDQNQQVKEQKQQEQKQQKQKQQQKKQQNHNKKPKKKKNKPKKQKPKQEQIKQDKYLNQDQIQSNRCRFLSQQQFKQCSSRINVLGYKCKFCELMFCGKHILAENHGCDQPAKNQARYRFQNQGIQKQKRKLRQMIIKQQQQRRHKVNKKK